MFEREKKNWMTENVESPSDWPWKGSDKDLTAVVTCWAELNCFCCLPKDYLVILKYSTTLSLVGAFFCCCCWPTKRDHGAWSCISFDPVTVRVGIFSFAWLFYFMMLCIDLLDKSTHSSRRSVTKFDQTAWHIFSISIFFFCPGSAQLLTTTIVKLHRLFMMIF